MEMHAGFRAVASCVVWWTLYGALAVPWTSAAGEGSVEPRVAVCDPEVRVGALPVRSGEAAVPLLSAVSGCGGAWLQKARWHVTLDGESLDGIVARAIERGGFGHAPPEKRVDLAINGVELPPGRRYRIAAELVGTATTSGRSEARVGVDWSEPPLVLGEFFGSVVNGRLMPPQRPRPGSALNVLVSGGLTDENLDVQIAPVGAGVPEDRFTPVKARWEELDPALSTSMRALRLTLPAHAAPGFYWLRFRIGSQGFAWRQIEIAGDDAAARERARTFEALEGWLRETGESPQHFVLRAPYGRLDAPQVAYRYPEADPLALPRGARVAFALRVVAPVHQAAGGEGAARPGMYLLVASGDDRAGAGEGAAITSSVNPVFRSADQFLQYAPGRVPAFKRDWWWDRRFRGTCGTAQCRFGYPYPGNSGNYVGPDPGAVFVTAPSAPDPLEWWRNRPTRSGGGICGTGYCDPPFPFGDLPKRPPATGGVALGGAAAENAANDLSASRNGTTERPPPSEPSPTPAPETAGPPRTCTAEFVEAVPGFNYRVQRRGMGRRARAYDPVTERPAIYTDLPERHATIWYSVMPRDWMQGSGGTPAWPEARVEFELEAARRWFDQYCIVIDFRRVDLPPAAVQHLGSANRRVLAQLPPGLKATIAGTALSDSRVLLSRSIYAHHRASEQRRPTDVSVLFMDRVVGDVGKRGASARPSQASHNTLGFNGIALHSADARPGREYILTHELTHAFGRRLAGSESSDRAPAYYRDHMRIGPHSWYHDSAAEEAMSRVTRETVADPLRLSGDTHYDYAEYFDALRSNLLTR